MVAAHDMGIYQVQPEGSASRSQCGFGLLVIAPPRPFGFTVEPEKSVARTTTATMSAIDVGELPVPRQRRP